MTGQGLPDPADGPELSVTQVAGLADEIASGGIRLIDCREPEEWDLNRLPNASLIPLSKFAEKAEALITGSKPVIVYCHHGMRSLRATHWLRSHGLGNSWSMRGGIHAWSTEIDPGVPIY